MQKYCKNGFLKGYKAGNVKAKNEDAFAVRTKLKCVFFKIMRCCMFLGRKTCGRNAKISQNNAVNMR